MPFPIASYFSIVSSFFQQVLDITYLTRNTFPFEKTKSSSTFTSEHYLTPRSYIFIVAYRFKIKCHNILKISSMASSERMPTAGLKAVNPERLHTYIRALRSKATSVQDQRFAVEGGNPWSKLMVLSLGHSS